MTIIKMLYLNTFFFIAYLIIFMPLIFPLFKHELIFNYLSLDLSSDLKSIIKLISFMIVVGILALSYQATKLHNYFGFSVMQAFLSPFTYIKSFFMKNEKDEKDEN